MFVPSVVVIFFFVLAAKTNVPKKVNIKINFDILESSACGKDE